MYKSIYGIVFLFVLILSGCKEEEAAKISSIEEDYKIQIEELKKENKRASDEYLRQLDEYSIYLQIADSNSRRIMRLISENDFAQLKSEFGIEATISDGKVFFKKDFDDDDIGLPIEQAAFHMSIAYFFILSNNIEIGYFLDDLSTDERYSVTFSFNKEGEFQYFASGDV